MNHSVRPGRVLIKALLLFVVANLAFAWFDPPVGKLTLYNHLLPGRLRFPYEQEPQYYLVGFNAPVYEDFDAMFGAHVISASKADDEFRVLLLGDSSTWSIDVQAHETLAAQLNKKLDSCAGRSVRVYNLGYPMPFLMRDLLILDVAMEYQPDLILWLVTLSSFEPKTAETYFIQPHAEQYLRLAATYQLSNSEYAEPIQPKTFYAKTIISQRARLKRILFNQAMGWLWALTGVDNHQGRFKTEYNIDPDVDADILYEKALPGESEKVFESLQLNVVSAAYHRAGDVPIILINQPIFIATGENSDVRYNSAYPRWIYDAYRPFISSWAAERGYPFFDFWNTLPPHAFADQNFHRNPAGESLFAEQLTPTLQELVCPN